MSIEELRIELESAEDIEGGWDRLLAALLAAFNCTTGTIHLLDREKNVLVIRAHAGMPEALLPKVSTIPIGKGMAGIAAERRQAVQVCNLRTDASGTVKPSAREANVEGAVAAPMLFRGERDGTIGLAKPCEYEFTPEEIDALMEVGGAVGSRLAGAAAGSFI